MERNNKHRISCIINCKLGINNIILCRKHHNEKHNTSREEFEKKYHIKGIYLNEKLVSELKEKYPGHFKAFKEGK